MQIACKRMCQDDITLLAYQNLRIELGKIEAKFCQMTLQQIKPITPSLRRQIRQHKKLDVVLAICSLREDKIKSDKLNDVLERIFKVLDIIEAAENQDDLTDGQEQTPMKSESTINIESEIDNKKSDDEMHRFIKSVETENSVDCLLQV